MLNNELMKEKLEEYVSGDDIKSEVANDALDFIINYESGLISSKEELINGFQSLLDSGLVWELQGSYQRMAIDLINQGLIIESY